MKKTLLSLIAALLLSTGTKAQVIQNGDFENVSICIATGSILPYWDDYNCTDLSVRPTNDARNGYTALLLDNRLMQTRPRAANSETLAPGPMPQQMVFAWKATMILHDTVYANVYTKCNSGGGWIRMGGWRYIDSLGMNTNWHQAYVPMGGMSPFCFDSIRVEFLGGNKQNLVSDGTRFYVDDISFNLVPVGIQEQNQSPLQVLAFPNPAADAVTLRLDSTLPFPATVRILNLSGQELCKLTGSDHGNGLRVETAGLADGLYLLEVTHNRKQHIQKLTVQH